LETRLEDASTLDKVQKLREELRTHNMDPVYFSAIAFEALRRNKASFDHLDAFLKDPRLNAPEARNISTFIANVQSHSLEREQIRHFILTLEQSIALGSVLPEELLHVIDNIDIAAWQATSNHEARRKKTRAHTHKLVFEAYRAIWKGMLACRVTPLSTRAIHLLLPKVAALRGGHGSASLHLELFQHAWPVDNHVTPGIPSIDQYLLSWVDHVHYSELCEKDPLNAHLTLDRKTLTNMINVLSRFPSPDFSRWISSAMSFLAARKPKTKGNEYMAWNAKLDILLTSLRGSELFETHFDFNTINLSVKDLDNEDHAYTLPIKQHCQLRRNWKDIYKILARRVSLADLQPHVTQFERVDICRIILHCWVPTLHRNSVLSAHGKQNVKAHGKRRQQLEQIKANFESMMISDWEFGGKLYGDIRAFPNLLAALAQSELPYRNLMGDIFRFVHENHGPAGLLNMCELLREKHVPFYSTSVSKVLDDISSTDPTLAYILYKCHNIWISRCPELLFALIKEGVHSHEIFRMLKDREESNTTPLAQRTHPLNATSTLRNTMVHMVADTISRYPHRGVRAAFRDVSACYRYLQDRHAPINPVMGRALVRAGITQFLQDKRWASTERFKWILGIVRDLEGDKVADELDTVMFRWRERVKVFMREQRRILRERGMFTGSRMIEGPIQSSPAGRRRDRHILRSRDFRITLCEDTSPLRIKLYTTGGQQPQQQSLRGLPHEEYIRRYLNDGKLAIAGFKGAKRLALEQSPPICTRRPKIGRNRPALTTSGRQMEKPSPTFFKSLPFVRRRRNVRMVREGQQPTSSFAGQEK
jgi:hypothetical protein